MGGTGSGWKGPKPQEWKDRVLSPEAQKQRKPRFTTEHIPMPGATKHPTLLPARHPNRKGMHRDNPPIKHVLSLAPLPVTIPVPVRPAERDPYRGSKIGELLDTLGSFQNDFAGFVKWAFPWGEPGTDLENRAGPEAWQAEQQQRISARLQAAGDEGCVIEEDVASGHGIGKSAEVAWAVLWAISTHADTKGVVTANTDTQLRTKTWAELAKWYELFIAKQLFTLTATAIYIADDKVREKKWRIDAIPWSKENTEGFAGMHNQGKRILVVFDEASAIDDKIWEVTEGALTDAQTQILWLRYGNPTKTSGKFFANCSEAGWVAKIGEPPVRNREKKRNTYTQVDSRTVSFSNKVQIQSWVDEYGEDSDFVRVRVKGQFPRAGFANFISPELVFQARRRKLQPVMYQAHQRIIAVDPARFGDDSSVITLRQGLKVHYQVILSGFDGVDLAGRIFELVRKDGPVACIVYDAIGNGADLDSSLRRMPGLPPLIPVQWGVPAADSDQFFNQRSEAWARMRDWLEHGQIPDDDYLADELVGLSYGYDARFRIQLESKKDAKKRGVQSPDRADSLALSMIPEIITINRVIAKVRPVQRRTVVWQRS